MGIRRASIGTTAERTVKNQSTLLPSGGAVSTGITTIVYTDSNYNTLTANAAATTFGTFRIIGSNLSPNANVLLANTSAGTIASITSNTTYVNTNEIRANVSVTAGNYSLYIFNPDGSAAIYYSGVLFEPYPVWTATSYASSTTVSVQLLTSSTAVEQPITYSLVSGTLPTGTTLAANGLISGTATGISGGGQTFTFTVSATDIYNETTQSSITLTITLVDQYFDYTTLLLNGETNTNTYIQDQSPNNFALTPVGAANPNRFSPLWGNGYYGNYFGGSSGLTDYITVASSTVFSIAGVPAMFEFWFYPTASNIANSDDTIFQSYSYPNGYRLDWNGTSLTFYTVNGGTATCPFASGTYLNIWTFIQIKYTGTTITFYINGTQVGTANQTVTITNVGTSSPFIFGVLPTYYTVRGYISNFRLSNVSTRTIAVPTAPFVSDGNTSLLTFQSSIFVDNSPNALAITPSGTVKVVSNQPFGALPSGVQNYGSSLFDGSTGYITTPTLPTIGTNPYTIELWLYCTNFPTFFRVTGGSGNQLGITNANNGTGQMQYYDGTTYTIGTITLNTWNHIAVSRTGGNIYTFLNGVLGQTATNSTSITSGQNFALGAYTSGINPFSGYISNARILNGTGLYTSNFTPPTAPLTAIANTALLTLQNKNGANNNVFYDDSVNNFTLTRTGTPTQGTFSPFSQTGWSNYLNGTSYITLPSGSTSSINNNNNFTLEFFTYITGYQSTYNSFFGGSSADLTFAYSSNGSWGIYVAPIGSGPIIQTGMSYLTFNQWLHIALVRNGSAWAIYVNGVQAATATSAQSFTNSTKSIGSEAGSNPMLGYISNFRYTNSVVYTSTFTPPTTPLTAIANTALLTCQSNRFIDNGPNGYALTIASTPQVQAFSPFAPGVSYSSANNGGSMYFNGSTDYLATATSAIFTTGQTTPFTIEAWVYITSNATTATIIGDPYTTGSFTLIINTTGKLAYNYLGGSATTGGNLVVPLNAWTHVAATRTGTSTYLYVNGVADSGNPFTNNSFDTGVQTSFYIGATASSSSIVNYFPGYISNVRYTPGVLLYTGAFTPPTAPFSPLTNTGLLTLGTNTGIQDATGKNDIITVGSAKTQSNTVKYGTGAMYFDGTSGYLTIQTPPNFSFGTANFTLEVWIYPLTVSPSQQGIVEMRTSNDGHTILCLQTNTLLWTGGPANLITSTGVISANTWQHVAVVRNSGTTVIYVNGVSKASQADTSTYVADSITRIGATFDPYYFQGYIDDLRITKGIARYTANFAPPASAFLTQ